MNMSSQKKYFMIEYTAEIVEANSQQEAIAIAKQRSKIELSKLMKKTLAELKTKNLLKEIEEDEKRTDKEEARATAKLKNNWLKKLRV
jgi:hypothetical protein